MNDKTKLRKTNLRRNFPLSRRSVLKMILPWLIAVVIAGTGVLATLFESSIDGPNSTQLNALTTALQILFGGMLIVFSAKLAYAVIYFHFFHYGIEQNCLYISKGVLVRKRGCFPLGRIHEIALARDILDAALGLWAIEIYTPGGDSVQFARLESFSRRTAELLQRYLLNEIIEQSAPQEHPAGQSARKRPRYGAADESRNAPAAAAAL